MVQEKYSRAEATYAKIKEEVCQRALALDEAFSQSTQVRRGMPGRQIFLSQPPWDSHVLWNVALFPL